MRIGIDARMYGLKHAGIGRYVENLVKELGKNPNLELVLFVRKETKEFINQQLAINNKQSEVIVADIPHYTLAEQFLLPGIIKKAKIDLMHFPHFNVPVFYSGKYVLTIHDLIKHSSLGTKTTTRSPWFYWLKYFGYRFVFAHSVQRAAKILVPSETVKKELVETYGLARDKVRVTYEGVDDKFKNQKSKIKDTNQNLIILRNFRITKPYVIYTGSVYLHKNVERLVEAIKLINQSTIINQQLTINLVIVCARSVFWERLKTDVKRLGAEKYVTLAGFVPDKELAVLYQEAEAFVFSTLSEGFGLPGLEAMSVGLPVVCSDIPVLREVYGEAAVYFNPLDVGDMAQKIRNVCSNDSSHRNKMKEVGFEQVKKYSWKKMAKETLEVYKSVLSNS